MWGYCLRCVTGAPASVEEGTRARREQDLVAIWNWPRVPLGVGCIKARRKELYVLPRSDFECRSLYTAIVPYCKKGC